MIKAPLIIHQVYPSGRNSIHGRLGIGDTKHRNQPQQISFFNDLYQVIDIQTANNFSIALCKLNISAFIKIIYKWTQYLQLIPIEIIVLVKLFYDTTYNKVFITKPITPRSTTVRPKTPVFNTDFGGIITKYQNSENDWKFVKAFKKRHIIDIQTGDGFAVFLKSNGTIFVLGKNERGQLGLGHNKDVNKKPVKLSYFVKCKTRINIIKCGGLHCLAIDIRHKLYGWGYNYYGQLGISRECKDIGIDTYDFKGENLPIVNGYFIEMGLKVMMIECGYYHSYVKCRDNEGMESNYLFGSNEYNECLTFDDRKKVFQPWCIDPIIEERTFGEIKSVSLGFENTKIMIDGGDNMDNNVCVVPDFNMTRYGL